jgi:hypothetical protein
MRLVSMGLLVCDFLASLQWLSNGLSLPLSLSNGSY